MDKIRIFSLLGNLVSLSLASLCLILNMKIFLIEHYSTGDLWIITYATYFARDLTLFYAIIVLSVINIILIFTQKSDRFLKKQVFITAIMSFIILLLFLGLPILYILSPQGNTPAILYSIYEGGWLAIGVLIILIINYLPFIVPLQKFPKHRILQFLILFIIFIGAALISEFFHESGHAFFVLSSGGTVTEFVPIPLFIGGQWDFGHVSWVGVPPNLVPLVVLGGEIFSWMALVIIGFLLYFRPFIKFKRFFISWFIWVWLDFPLYTINNAIGLPHWFFLGSSHGDIVAFCNITGFPLSIMIIFAIVQLVLGGLFILKLYRRNMCLNKMGEG